jgi:hypothetical protein
MFAPSLPRPRIRREKPVALQRVYCGAPSCGPLLQHELLLALRDVSPPSYARLVAETGLSLDKTETVAGRQQIVSAAGAIMLAHVIAREPEWARILNQAADSLMARLYFDLPFSLKFALNNLPRPLRVRLAFSTLASRMYQIGGSNSQLAHYKRQGHRAYVQIKDGMFADYLETRAGAREFYGAILRGMFWHFARVECSVSEISSEQILLHECWFAAQWED